MTPPEAPYSIKQAQLLAFFAHLDQEYAPGVPYFKHLQDVHGILIEFGFEGSTELRCAAYLHDILEDTRTTPEDILNAGLDPYVLALVDAVTDDKSRPRVERHERTYPRIRRIPEAVTLKIADRLANVRAAREGRPDLLTMYRDEYLGLRIALGTPLAENNVAMWMALTRALHL